MTTSAIDTNNNTSSAAAALAAGPKNTLDKDSFLRLLVAQLQHQDPTQTQDSDKMVQQMTNFASLEQMQNQTKALESLQSQNLGIFQTQATSLVGKKVRISQGVSLQNGKADSMLNLPSDAASTAVTIKDATGKSVRVLNLGPMTAGDHAIKWDGRDGTGTVMPEGIYTMEVACKNKAGEDIAATTSCYATVESVSFANGGVLVKAGGRNFNLSDISEVSASNGASSASPSNYAHMIGKHVRISGNLAVEDGKSNFRLSLGSSASLVQVAIKDDSGKVIRVLSMGSKAAGDSSATWDGLDSAGNKVNNGVYTAEVTALDSTGHPVKASTSSLALISSVLSTEGTVMFRIANRNFGLNDFSEITA